MKRIIFCAVLFCLNTGCPQPPVGPHPTPVVTDTNMCVPAEEHLQELCKADPVKNSYCCKVAAPTKKGKTFTQFCIEKQNQGVFLNPRCLASVTSCDKINACTQSE